MPSSAAFLALFAAALAVNIGLSSASIDCYSCSSVNGTDPYCDDPIAPAFTKLERRCMVPKENHIGKFPANFCVKMTGRSIHTDETLVVRTCVLEDMNSQCGTFKFENDTLKGCLLTCKFDGCNAATPIAGGVAGKLMLLPTLLLISASRSSVVSR